MAEDVSADFKAWAKERGIPLAGDDYDIALRPYRDNEDADPLDGKTRLDDIVVMDVECFRAEDMGDWFFVCCYLRNGDRITWNVRSDTKRPRSVVWTVGEVPEDGTVRYEHEVERAARLDKPAPVTVAAADLATALDAAAHRDETWLPRDVEDRLRAALEGATT